ncbi:uncharacterized protein LOC134947478 isoform X2 [Pseudophryne corroboree]|uniref:uncharacterized protein LOC134947478 isoform X2 n=1 Tax=Pseudophryne corroboree TaxID=495146 RepID=UPI003082185B
MATYIHTGILLSAITLWTAWADLDARIMETGRSQLQILQNFAQHPGYGDCWSRALQRVDVGCKQLNEEEQSRIALAFTHCHLERLTVNSDSVARQLEATNIMAEEMMQAQNATLQSQEAILRNGHLLKQTLQESTMGVKLAFQEMQQSASEQRLLFSEIFNRITYLHQFVVGESNTLYSFLYNLLGCSAVFLLTSTQRTAGARLILFSLVAANVYTERMVCSYILGGSQPSYDETENVAFWVGISRKISISLGLLVLLYFSVTYRDVQRQSLEVLRGLQETKAELQSILQEAEKLLNKPSCGQDEILLKEDLLFGDSGITESSVIQEHSIQASLLDSVCSVQLETQITSTPKRRVRSRSRSRSRSVSHRRSVRPSEPAVYNIAVTQPEAPRYSLRSNASVSSPLSAL